MIAARLLKSFMTAPVLLACLLSAPAGHAAARIVAEPSVQRLTLGEVVQVTVSVQADEAGNAEIIPPDSTDYRIEGHTTSSRFEFSFGGPAQQTLQYIYALRPTRGGTIEVGPFTYRNPLGTTTRSNRFTLQVVEPPPAPRALAEIRPDEPLTALLQVTPPRVFLGQQANLTITRFARRNMDECRGGAVRIPKAWHDDLLDSPAPPQLTTLQGVRFESSLLEHIALFPLEVGVIEIPPVEIQCRTMGRGFLGGGSTVLTRQTAPVLLEVMPLPEADRPADFTGAVGQFSISTQLDRARTSIGEPVTWTIHVTGRGNLKGFSLTPPSLPDPFTNYPPTTAEEVSYDDQGRLQGRKTMEIILSPKRSGQLELPAVRLAFFDPEAGQYREVRSAPLSLIAEASQVLQPRSSSPTAEALIATQLPELPELRPIRPGSQPLLPGALTPRAWTEQIWYWVLLLLLPAVFIGLQLRDWVAAHQLRNQAKTRFRKAKRIALEQIEQAAQEAPGLPAFWAVAVGALHAYLASRLGEPTQGLLREELRRFLIEEAGYPRAPVEEWLSLLEEADLVLYAGQSAPTQANLPAAKDRFLRLLDVLDRHEPRTRSSEEVH